MKPAPLFLLGAALALGPAVAARHDDRDARELSKALAGRVAGPAERCVSSRQLGSPQIVGQTLLYRDGRTVWRSDIASCPVLDRDPILIIELFGGDQLCASDRFRTADRGGIGIPGPSCNFGPFVPYRKPR